MGIYIEDLKKCVVRHYSTSEKVEKAIETLLRLDEQLVWSETHKGYMVYVNKDAGKEIESTSEQVIPISVIEDIKAEIKNLVTGLYDSNYDRLALSAMETGVNEIIDNHISGKEKE